MRHINLLPWREEKRRLAHRRFYKYTLGVAGVAALILALVMVDLRGMVGSQQARNQFLRQQIQGIDTQIGEVQGLRSARKRMNERLAMVQSLQRSRVDLVHILDALPRTVPVGVVLEDVKQSGDAWVIIGVASSNADISQFIRKLDESPWFHSARLTEVNSGKEGGERDSRFVLEVGTRRPEAGG